MSEDETRKDEARPASTSASMSLEELRTYATAVAMRLPSFWLGNLRIWFFQMEAQFFRCGITTLKTKYQEILCALPTQYATKSQDLLLDPPEDQSYKKLKDLLIVRIVDWERQKLWQLLRLEELGDQKPFHLLRKMKSLLGDKAKMIDSWLARELFLQCLQKRVDDSGLLKLDDH